MSEQRFSFRPSELRHVSVTCRKCKVKMTFDAADTARPVEHCPGCHESLPNLSRLLADYRSFLEKADTEYFAVQVETDPVVLDGAKS